MTIQITRLYIFDGIEHTEEDPVEDLTRDASAIIEKLSAAPVAIAIKPIKQNNPAFEEIIDTIKKSGNYEISTECQTLNFIRSINFMGREDK